MPTTLLVFEFIGTSELMIIAVVALIIFGPRKLPDLGRSLGRSLSEFKRASEDFKRTWEYEVELEQRNPGRPQVSGVAEGASAGAIAAEADADGAPVARGSVWHEDAPAVGDTASGGEGADASAPEAEGPPPAQYGAAAPDAYAPSGADPTAPSEGGAEPGGPRTPRES